jgi:predicted secreted protein
MVLSLFMSFILFITPAQGVETVVVTKAFNGREIKVRVGGQIRVNLEEIGAAGYSWVIKDLDKEHFELLSTETRAVLPKGDITGAPIMRTWLISTRKKGEAKLKFLFYRTWEGEKSASDIFVLRVHIL